MVIVVMGVAGAGKTAVGERLAAVRRALFYDADDFHSPEAVAKMERGQPLDDVDRAPWLDRLAALVEDAASTTRPTVLACSALKARYRERLRAAAMAGGDDIRFVYLRVTPDVAAQRVGHRSGHYMPPILVQSQFDALEEPADAIVLDGARALDAVVMEAQAILESDEPSCPPARPSVD